MDSSCKIGLEAPLTDANIIIDGVFDDWAGASGIDLDGGRISFAQDEDNFYIRIDCNSIVDGEDYNFQVAFFRESFNYGDDWPNWGFEVFGNIGAIGEEGGYLNIQGNTLPYQSNPESNLDPNRLASNNGTFELALPKYVIGAYTQGPIYLNRVSIFPGDCEFCSPVFYWCNWHMEDEGWWPCEFWGYRIDFGFEEDTDEDGLSDWEEWGIYGTNPNTNDTDGDGLSDPNEIRVYNTDPKNPDTDNDGLDDGDEIEAGSNPHHPDTDNDGLLDGYDDDPLNFSYGSLDTALKFLEEGQLKEAQEILDHLKDDPGFDDKERAVYAVTSMLYVGEEAKNQESVFEQVREVSQSFDRA